MDQQVRRRDLVEKYRQSDKTIKPRPAGPMPKTLSHFATVEEWQKHKEEVVEAQRNGTPF